MLTPPTTATLRAFDPEPLMDASRWWSQMAESHRATFSAVRLEANAMSWEGQFADAGKTRADFNHDFVAAHAQRYQDAAEIAREAAGSLHSLAGEVTHRVDALRERKFYVDPTDPTFLVRDIAPSETIQEQVEREAEAAAATPHLLALATHFNVAETEAGSRLAQAVDFATFPLDGSNNAPPPPSEKRRWWDATGELLGGGALTVGGGLATAGGLLGEVPSAGSDTGVTIMGIGGLVGGFKMFGDGVDDVLNLMAGN